MGALATIKASSETTDGRVAVIELLAPQGVGSPLHVHHREDEWVYVNEGALTFWVGGQVIEAPAGSFVYGLRDVPHTFLVSSPEARYFLVAEPAGFENLMRAMGENGFVLLISWRARANTRCAGSTSRRPIRLPGEADLIGRQTAPARIELNY